MCSIKPCLLEMLKLLRLILCQSEIGCKTLEATCIMVLLTFPMIAMMAIVVMKMKL